MIECTYNGKKVAIDPRYIQAVLEEPMDHETRTGIILNGITLYVDQSYKDIWFKQKNF